MNPASKNKHLQLLNDRADMLKACRAFFDKQGVIEVDCPILSHGAAIDTHIDLIPATYSGSKTVYLHSSPEYGMKRLLAEGMGDIYQISHVFRDAEFGQIHNPEFTLIEWYRKGFSFDAIVDETLQVICLFLGEIPKEVLSYRDAFLMHSPIDPFESPTELIRDFLKEKELLPSSPPALANRDDYLNLVLGLLIEPQLGKESLCAIVDYPATQAALAKTYGQVAKRFEVYYQGTELANGYDELANAAEQRTRFEISNRERLALGKTALPIDEHFLQALGKLPECCGVAVGFDRLMMLRHKLDTLAPILPFAWSES